MDEALSFTSQFMKVQGDHGAGKQVLGIVDDVTATFRDELANAKSNLAKEEKVSKGSKKEDTPPEEVAEEAEESEAEETRPQQAQKASTEKIDAEPELLAKVSDEPALEGEAISDEEAPLEEAETVAEEKAPEDVAAPEPEEVEVAKPKVEEASVEDAAVQEEDTDVLASVSEKPAEELPVEEEVAEEETEGVATDQTTKPAEEPVAPELAAAAPKPEEAPTPQVEAENAEGDAAVKESPIKKAKVPLQQPIAQKEREPAELKPEKPQVAETPVLAEEQTEQTEEVPDNFHSITPDGDEQAQANAGAKPEVVTLDGDESQRIIQELANIAQRSQVQAPVAGKVSGRVLEGLKAHDVPLARQIESLKGQSLQGNGLAQAAEAKGPAPLRDARPLDKPYANPKLERLKQKVVQQVKFQMRLAMKNKMGEVKMQLQPNVMGKVRISLMVEESHISANFVVENQSVKELLQRSSTQLQEVLREHGYDVTDVEVSVADDGGTDTGSGKGFASVEDQKAAREYIASLGTMGLGTTDGAGVPNETEGTDADSLSDPNQILNIVA